MNYKLWLPLILMVGTLSPAYYSGSRLSNGSGHITPTTAMADPAKKIVCTYFLYKGFGAEKDIDSYTQTLIAPLPCGGHDIICYFRICDDDGIVTDDEFNTAFEALDLVSTGDDLLSDEEEILGELEKYTLTK
jgi:hypothetical protein